MFLLDGKQNAQIKYKGEGAVWIVGLGENLFCDSLNENVRFLLLDIEIIKTYKQTTYM